MKARCFNCGKEAHWFIKRRKNAPQIGSGQILSFCRECFTQRDFGERVFPFHLYLRYYNPAGLERETLEKLNLEEIVHQSKGKRYR